MGVCVVWATDRGDGVIFGGYLLKRGGCSKGLQGGVSLCSLATVPAGSKCLCVLEPIIITANLSHGWAEVSCLPISTSFLSQYSHF